MNRFLVRVQVLLIIGSVSTGVYAGKVKRHVTKAGSTNTNYSSELAGSHKPIVSVQNTHEGTVVISITTPLSSTHSHYIKSHAILNDDKDLLVENRFDFASREAYSSSYKFERLTGHYYVVSNCNEHGRWTESFDIK